MPELISIEEAARITGFPYEEIEDWVKSRKITSFHTRTGTRMVDPENLRDFIAHIEHLGIQKLYLQLVIQDKEEEADEIIAQYDDYLFCLRSLKPRCSSWQMRWAAAAVPASMLSGIRSARLPVSTRT